MGSKKHHWWLIALFAILALGIVAYAVAEEDLEQQSPVDNGTAYAPLVDEYFCEPGVPPDGVEVDEIEGEQLTDVEQWAADEDFTVRTIAVDGEGQAVTQDYRPDRINVQVDAGTVTRYCGNY